MTDGPFHCKRFNCLLDAKACAKRRRLKDSLGRPAFPECVGCEKAARSRPAKKTESPSSAPDVVQTAAASLELATFHLVLSLSRLGTMLGADDRQRSAASPLLEHFLGLPVDDDVVRAATRLAGADPLLLAVVSTNLPGLFRVDAKAIEDHLPMKDLDKELLRRLRLEKDRRLKLLQVLLQGSRTR